jgi:hypothetical protein
MVEAKAEVPPTKESMKSRVKEFATFFAMQLIGYGLCVISWRAVAQADYAASIAVDVTYASMQFWIFRKIARTEDSIIGWLGYVAGSAAGTGIGIWISKLILGD